MADSPSSLPSPGRPTPAPSPACACSACGYDLSAVPDARFCPECGAKAALISPRCPCGYDRTGLAGIDPCPACGHAGPAVCIEHTDDGDRIATSAPCVGCGANLAGLDPSADCPACGRPISKSLLGASAPGDAAVAGNLRCSNCSYNLRGLAIDGLCPECATPIRNSLRGFLLTFASPAYLRAIRIGADLIFTAVLLWLILTLVRVVLPFLQGFLPGGVHSFTGFLRLIPTLLISAGYWLCTRPDPALSDDEHPHAARRILRLAAAVYLATTLLDLLFQMAAMGWPAPVPPGFAGLIAILGFVAWVTAFLAMMLYTQWIARRIPDARLARRCGLYAWLLPLIFAIGAPLLLLGPVAALVLYLLLLQTVRDRLRWIARSARAASAA